jgi:hypothetical protein
MNAANRKPEKRSPGTRRFLKKTLHIFFALI